MDGGCLAEGVFVHGVGVTLDTPLTILGDEHLDIKIAKERLVGDIVVAIADVAVDDESIDRMELELRLVLLAAVRAFAVRADGDTDR